MPMTTATGVYFTPTGSAASASDYGTGASGANATVNFPTLSTTSGNGAISAAATGNSVKTAVAFGGLVLTGLAMLVVFA